MEGSGGADGHRHARHYRLQRGWLAQIQRIGNEPAGLVGSKTPTNIYQLIQVPPPYNNPAVGPSEEFVNQKAAEISASTHDQHLRAGIAREGRRRQGLTLLRQSQFVKIDFGKVMGHHVIEPHRGEKEPETKDHQPA